MFILLWKCPSSLIPRPRQAFSCLLTILQVTEQGEEGGGGGGGGGGGRGRLMFLLGVQL